MKIRKLLLTGIVAIGFASCSSDNDHIPTNPSPSTTISGDIKLKVDVASISTRIHDVAVGTGAQSEINNVDIYLLEKADGNQALKVHSSLTVAKNDIEKLSSSQYIIEKINGNISGLALVVNKAGDIQRVKDGTLLTELEAKAHVSIINEIQPVTDQGISNSPMYGVAEQITVEGSTNPTTGNKLYVANITLKPTISRVQIYGELKTSGRIKNLQVTKIFLDNFNTKSYNEVDKFNIEKMIDPELTTTLEDKFPFFDMNKEGLEIFKTKSNVYAYHLYPQVAIEAEKPKDRGVKLVLELTYDQLDAEGKLVNENVTEYATLRFATISKGNNIDDDSASLSDEILAIEPAKVYTINLGIIDWTGDGEYVNPKDPNAEDKDKDEFNPGDGGETPNATQKDLKIAVSIQEWTEVLIIPQN